MTLSIVNTRYEQVPVGSVRPHPKNPRTGDLDAICESIKANGFFGALVVQRSTGFILAGNHRFLAAKRLGFTELPAVFVEVDDRTAKRILLADNRTSDLAGYDDEALVEILRELQADGGLFGTAFDEAALEELIAEASANDDVDAVLDDEDEDVAAVGDDAESVPGEVYRLGPHRLLCGDATSVTDLEKLLEGEQVDLLWTDPPYNVNYQGGTKAKLTIKNDSMDDAKFREFLVEAFSTASTVMKPGAGFYIAHADSNGHHFREAVRTVGWKLSQCLIWVKDAFVMGRADYHWRHEPILYGWKDGAAHHAVKDRSQDTVWEIPRPRKNDVHPTMKPVPLIERALKNSSHRGERVLDLFGGSGSTLIAAARTGRIAYLVELDPRYCDVIRRRWEQFCAQHPELAAASAA